jgi:hypothetical protein
MFFVGKAALLPGLGRAVMQGTGLREFVQVVTRLLGRHGRHRGKRPHVGFNFCEEPKTQALVPECFRKKSFTRQPQAYSLIRVGLRLTVHRVD